MAFSIDVPVDMLSLHELNTLDRSREWDHSDLGAMTTVTVADERALTRLQDRMSLYISSLDEQMTRDEDERWGKCARDCVRKIRDNKWGTAPPLHKVIEQLRNNVPCRNIPDNGQQHLITRTQPQPCPHMPDDTVAQLLTSRDYRQHRHHFPGNVNRSHEDLSTLSIADNDIKILWEEFIDEPLLAFINQYDLGFARADENYDEDPVRSYWRLMFRTMSMDAAAFFAYSAFSKPKTPAPILVDIVDLDDSYDSSAFLDVDYTKPDFNDDVVAAGFPSTILTEHMTICQTKFRGTITPCCLAQICNSTMHTPLNETVGMLPPGVVLRRVGRRDNIVLYEEDRAKSLKNMKVVLRKWLAARYHGEDTTQDNIYFRKI